ncbi:MAG: hypothetical protein JOY62_01420 [Acidobacteriaceae bacterium]|nr:hypothetical protein [Acidobacteriaceae bacterium]
MPRNARDFALFRAILTATAQAMPERMGPIPVTRRHSPGDDRLDSWKEIASYLGREVRTVQGWEKNEGLPVHRHQHGRQGSVYAFKSELDAWREERQVASEPVLAETPPAQPGKRIRVPFQIAIAAVAVAVLLTSLFLWRSLRKPSVEPAPSIVVLPFLDLSPQKDQEYFTDGMTEEIIDALSRVPNLHVVARTSAFAFKGKPTDIREIGRQLNVTAVLEGSVRKSGDQLRITAQLNRVSDGYHLWSRTFNRQLRDIFEVQREIAQAIASEMQAGTVPSREPTRNLEAYRFYQEGRFFFNQHLPPDSYRKAIERYQQAVDRDPNFALAYSGLADAYAYLAEMWVAAPSAVMPKAKQAAEKAVALDGNLGEAHTSLGIVKLDYDWDRQAAQSEFQKAMQLNPGSGWVHHWFAHSLEAQGKLDDATKEMQASLALDPLSVPIGWDVAHELIWAKKYDEALNHLNKSLALFPNHPILLIQKATALYLKGDRQSGHKISESLRAVAGRAPKDPALISFFGLFDAFEARRDDARQALNELERLRRNEYVEPFLATQVCFVLRDRECLFEWFKRGHDERSTQFVYTILEPDVYGNDPRMRALTSEIR